MRTSLKTGIAILVFATVVAAALYFGTKPVLDQNAESTVSLRALSWRAQLYFRKATGNLPDLSWVELGKMTLRRGGFSLENMFIYGSSLENTIINPYIQANDIEAGQRIFRRDCAMC